jgi:hypothetical protein
MPRARVLFSGSPGHSLSPVEDLEQRTLSHLDQPIVTDLAREHFPQARLIARPTVKDALAEVCESRVDGAFVEENSALSTLLDGIPCAGLPVRMIGIPSIRTHLDVAATFGAAGVADEIREEIGTIAKEGRLSLMASRWGDFSVRDTETIQSLREARQRVSILVVAIIVFACLLLLAMWQTIHRGREANRAIRAEQTLRQTEQKLRQRESEEQFRHIPDTAPVIIWITDPHTHAWATDRFGRRASGPYSMGARSGLCQNATRCHDARP